MFVSVIEIKTKNAVSWVAYDSTQWGGIRRYKTDSLIFKLVTLSVIYGRAAAKT